MKLARSGSLPLAVLLLARALAAQEPVAAAAPRIPAPQTPARTSLGIDLGYIRFDGDVDPWTLGALSISRRGAAGSIIARVNAAERFSSTGTQYEVDAYPVQRSFVFNGQRFTVGLPVSTTVDFSTYSFGYEYDFLYFPRGFVGANINLKYTNINVDLQSPIGAEFFTQAAPIPAVGFAGRGYITRNFAIDGEFTFFRIPDSIEEQLEGDGSYNDFDIHGTYNFNKYVGAQGGWKKTTIFYQGLSDSGDLKFSGIYFGGVVRY